MHNSSFETDEDSDGVPDGWLTSGKLLPDGRPFDPPSAVLDRTAAASGAAPVRLLKEPGEDTTAGVSQRVDAMPGRNVAGHRPVPRADEGG